MVLKGTTLSDEPNRYPIWSVEMPTAKSGRSVVNPLPKKKAASVKPSIRFEQKPKRISAGQAEFSSKWALAKAPLGIVLAVIFVVQTVLAIVIHYSPNLAPADTDLLVRALVFLLLMTTCGFFVVWFWFPERLYPPSQFRDEKVWLRAVARTDIIPSKRLPLPRPSQPSEKIAPLQKLTVQQYTNPTLHLIDIAVELEGGHASRTSIKELNTVLRGSSVGDYLTVDVGQGNRWLLSRLFVLMLMLIANRQTSCVVFVQTQGQHEKLLGVANPPKFCGALAHLYPWFNETLAKILTAQPLAATKWVSGVPHLIG
jgi:hypothetical protein